jgi:hypothetical protein
MPSYIDFNCSFLFPSLPFLNKWVYLSLINVDPILIWSEIYYYLVYKLWIILSKVVIELRVEPLIRRLYFFFLFYIYIKWALII